MACWRAHRNCLYNYTERDSKMAILLINCPHCGGNSMTFTVKAQSQLSKKPRFFFLFTTCGGCSKGVLAECENPLGYDLVNNAGNLKDKDGVRLVEYWPAPKTTDAPRFTPANVARFYSQAVKAMSREDWDAAGSMSRKALDVATRHLDTSDAFAKKPLASRIDDLAARQLITPQMREWAHAIRVDGNDAVHDPDQFTQEEAETLYSFADLFLQYVFTMPGMLNERKKAKESRTTSS